MYQKRINKKTTKEAAVSPVVGVMLMLVVTIVIAAVVTIFASGLAGTQQAAPAVSVSVDLDTADKITTLTFLSVSEPIAKSDLQLNLKSTKGENEDDEYKYTLYSQIETLGTSGSVTSGSTVKKELALAGTDKAEEITPTKYVHDVLALPDVGGKPADEKKTYIAAYTNGDATKLYTYDVATGKFVEEDIATNDPRISSMTKLQYPSASSDYKYATCKNGYTFEKNDGKLKAYPMETLEPGDKINVELLHIPTNSIIYSKTFTVGA